MPFIIKNKRHFKTRLPKWVAVIFFIGLSPILIGLIGEVLASGTCASGDCYWVAFPYFSIVTIPIAGLALLVFLVIVIFDSIQLFRKREGKTTSSEMNYINLYESENEEIKVSMG